MVFLGMIYAKMDRDWEVYMNRDIKRVDRQLKYEGRIFNVYEDTIEFNGEKQAKWDYLSHNGAAAILPITKEGKVVLVSQYRSPLNGFILEIPAGGRDGDEPFIDCAKRELEEETAYRCDEMEYLLTMYPTVAYNGEKIDIFLATQLEEGKQHLDPDEYVDIVEMELSECVDMIFRGEIVDSKTIAAILAYQNKLLKDKCQ